MNGEVRTVLVQLSNGAQILVEATIDVGEDSLLEADAIPSFDDVRQAIEGLARDIHKAIEAVTPTKATVELSIGAKYENGRVLGLLLKGAAEAGIKITLEWSPSAAQS